MVTNTLYINRSLYYWARNYSKQLVKNNNYNKLKPVISINLLKDKIFNDINKVHSVFMPFDLDYKEKPLTDHLQIHYIEFAKYLEGLKVKSTLTDWLEYFNLENKNEEAKMQTLLDNNSIIKEAHEVYNKFTSTDELRDIYEAREKAILDYNTDVYCAKLEDKKSTLTRQMKLKFQLTDTDINFINKCDDLDKLDDAIDEFVFANDKVAVLDKLK